MTLHWHILHNINVIKFMLNISVLSNEKCPTYQWRILNEMNQWKDYLFYQNILKLSISKLSFYSVMKFTFFSKTAMRIVNGNKMLMSSWQLLCFVHFDYHLISYMCFLIFDQKNVWQDMPVVIYNIVKKWIVFTNYIIFTWHDNNKCLKPSTVNLYDCGCLSLCNSSTFIFFIRIYSLLKYYLRFLVTLRSCLQFLR